MLFGTHALMMEDSQELEAPQPNPCYPKSVSPNAHILILANPNPSIVQEHSPEFHPRKPKHIHRLPIPRSNHNQPDPMILRTTPYPTSLLTSTIPIITPLPSEPPQPY